MEMKRILCAIDLMDTINPAIEPAKMFAKLTGASAFRGLCAAFACVS